MWHAGALTPVAIDSDTEIIVSLKMFLPVSRGRVQSGECIDSQLREGTSRFGEINRRHCPDLIVLYVTC